MKKEELRKGDLIWVEDGVVRKVFEPAKVISNQDSDILVQYHFPYGPVVELGNKKWFKRDDDAMKMNTTGLYMWQWVVTGVVIIALIIIGVLVFNSNV